MNETLLVTVEDLAIALHTTEEDYDKQPVLTPNDKICWGRARRMFEKLVEMAQKPPETDENG